MLKPTEVKFQTIEQYNLMISEDNIEIQQRQDFHEKRIDKQLSFWKMKEKIKEIAGIHKDDVDYFVQIYRKAGWKVKMPWGQIYMDPSDLSILNKGWSYGYLLRFYRPVGNI